MRLVWEWIFLTSTRTASMWKGENTASHMVMLFMAAGRKLCLWCVILYYLHAIWVGLPDYFMKGTLLRDGEEHSLPYFFSYSTPNPNLTHLHITVHSANESVMNQTWLKDSSGDSFLFLLNYLNHWYECSDQILPGFSEVCTIKADMSTMQDGLAKIDTIGGAYWRLDFKVAIAFGSTSLSSRLTWKEKASVFMLLLPFHLGGTHRLMFRNY